MAQKVTKDEEEILQDPEGDELPPPPYWMMIPPASSTAATGGPTGGTSPRPDLYLRTPIGKRIITLPRHPLTSDDAALGFLAPVFRDYIMSEGLVLGKESAAHILSRKGGGNLLSIVTGGIQESLNARPGAYKLVLRNRKGFIRLTLMHGAALMPIFSFGENDIYEQVENSPGSWLRWFQDRLHKSTRGSIPLFYGRGVFQYSFGLVPYR
ncbi:hypothetical protein JEQ12_006386 [Ovis aries]|uniref:Acyltransferase n=1 Tax=Ovis aries TaxID=9940 RepID=A0A835ZU56_SHEEP|nr:hypothetical protein JEQ12_006386 [Ovis aries]